MFPLLLLKKILCGAGVSDLSEKSQVAIYFLRNTGMDLPLEAIASQGRFIPPSVKHIDD